MKIAKYIPHISLTIAAVGLALAILDFAVWGNWGLGLLGAILAVGGFVFTGQLLQRRVTRREHVIERRRQVSHAGFEVEPSMNVQLHNQSFKDQEAAW